MEMCIFFMVKVELYASISKMQSVEQMTHIFLSDVVLLLKGIGGPYQLLCLEHNTNRIFAKLALKPSTALLISQEPPLAKLVH